MPRFRHEMEKHLKENILTDTDRKHVIQTMATLLMQHFEKPSLKQCGTVAKDILKKHPFLKDDEGEGEVSFSFCVCDLSA